MTTSDFGQLPLELTIVHPGSVRGGARGADSAYDFAQRMREKSLSQRRQDAKKCSERPGRRAGPSATPYESARTLPSPDIYIYIQSRAHSLRSAVAGSMREALHAGKYPAAKAAVSRMPIAAAIATKSFDLMPNRNDSTKRMVKRAAA